MTPKIRREISRMADAAAQGAAESKDAAAAIEAFKAEATEFLRRHEALFDRAEASAFAESCLRSSFEARGLELPALEASTPSEGATLDEMLHSLEKRIEAMRSKVAMWTAESLTPREQEVLAERFPEAAKTMRPRRAKKSEEPAAETSSGEKPKRPRKAKTSAKPAKIASEG